MPVFAEADKKKGTAAPMVNEIVGRVNDNTKRLRLIEDRERLLTSRISSLDENVSAKLESLENARKDLEAKIATIDEKMNSLQNTMKEVVKQLQFLPKKTELKRVEEKVKILEPVITQIGKQLSGQQSG